MPNWVQNEVRVTGEEKDISAFLTFVGSKESDFDFNQIMPMPTELKKTVKGADDMIPAWQKQNSKLLIAEFGDDNWFDWCINNWGCKWNADEVVVEQHKGELKFDLETPWSPPREICEKLNTEFPALDISWFYKQEGMRASGWL